jgi:hypothetical protein
LLRFLAVPLKTVPDPRYGHRQTFDRERLLALGRTLGGRCEYFEYHGGWLVCDRLNDKRGRPEHH